MSVMRIWRGTTTRDDAGEYEAYLVRTGFAEYIETPGNVATFFTRRDLGEHVEFLLVTVWESENAIVAFAGSDISRAKFYPEDEAFLVEKDTTVDHFDVFEMR